MQTPTPLNPHLNLLRLGKRLPPPRTLGIKIRPFPQTHRPVPSPLPKVFPNVIRRRSMIHAPIIPDSEIVRILPAVAHLQIVVINYQTQKPREKPFALAGGESVDVLYVVAEGEDRFPAGYGVGAYYLERG